MVNFYKKNFRIGIDLDEVCVDFLSGYSKLTGKDFMNVSNFYFSYDTQKILDDAPPEFWLDLKPKFDPKLLPFTPACYISRRHFDPEITRTWIERNQFPCMPVIHVESSKIDACREMKLDYYIDDHIKNFQELNAAGIPTFLMDCVHNRQYNVDPYRITDIYELPRRIMDIYH